MPDTQSPSRTRKMTLRAVLSVAVILVLLVVGFRWWRTAALERALERWEQVSAPIRARGDVLGALDREERTPPGTNGAPALIAALDALVYASGDSVQWPAGPWSLDDDELRDQNAADRAALTAFVEEQSEFFAAIDSAAASDLIVFPAVRDEAGTVQWAPTVRVMEIAELLRARALRASDSRDRVSALETALRIGRRWEPRSALEALVAAHFLDAAARDLCRLLAENEIDASDAAQRLTPLLSPDAVESFPRLILAERAWLLSMHDALVDLPGVDDDADEPLMSDVDFEREEAGISLAGPEVVDAASDIVELTERMLALSLADHAALTTAVEEATADLRSRPDSWAPWTRVRQMLGNGLATIAVRGPELYTKVDTRLRLARIAIAATEHHDVHGRWPADLGDLASALGGAVPDDPFSGAPFSYERRGDDGVRVAASAGGADDGPALSWDATR